MSRLENLAEILRCPVAGVDRVVVFCGPDCVAEWIFALLLLHFRPHQIFIPYFLLLWISSEDCRERTLQLSVKSCYSYRHKPLREKKALVCADVLERVVCFGEGVSAYADVASRCGESS